jgi:hypothetical protein
MPLKIEYDQSPLAPSTANEEFQIMFEQVPVGKFTSAFSAFNVNLDEIPEAFARGMMEFEMGLEIDFDDAVGE